MKRIILYIIAIVIGTIISFSLMIVFRNTSLPFNRQIGIALAYTVVAVSALIFGSIVGGTIGLLSRLLLGIPYRIGLFGIMEIILILIFGLFGFLIGKIYEINYKRYNDKSFIQNFVKIFCIIFIMYIILGIISSIVIQISWTNFSITSLFWNDFLYIIKYGLIISIIGIVLMCIYQKIFKKNVPFSVINK